MAGVKGVDKIKLSSSEPNAKQLSTESPEGRKPANGLKKIVLSEMNDADSTLGDFMKTFVLH